MATYIKQESDDGWYSSAGLFRAPNSSDVQSQYTPSTKIAAVIYAEPDDEHTVIYRAAYLTKKSRGIQRSKTATGDLPEGLGGSVFETTVMIINGDNYLQISHGLLDTGTAHSFISKTAACRAGLKVYKCRPRNIEMADGSITVHDNYATFTLVIAGVSHSISAYIDEGKASHHLLIGDPAITKFDAKQDPNFGGRRRGVKRWTIGGQNDLRTRYVLERDESFLGAQLRTIDYIAGERLAARPGLTQKEKHARDVVRRGRAEARRRQDKYEAWLRPDYDIDSC